MNFMYYLFNLTAWPATISLNRLQFTKTMKLKYNRCLQDILTTAVRRSRCLYLDFTSALRNTLSHDALCMRYCSHVFKSQFLLFEVKAFNGTIHSGSNRRKIGVCKQSCRHGSYTTAFRKGSDFLRAISHIVIS